MGIQFANPNDYVARYGTQLEDAQTLITHARQAGVVEDIVSIFYNTKSERMIMFFCFKFSHHLVGQHRIFNPIVLVESQQIITNHHHLIIQLEVLIHHLVVLILLIIQIIFWVVILVMNRILLNRYMVNRTYFYLLFLS